MMKTARNTMISENPYEVLGVAQDAGEDEVRQRYLELVRQHPPDRDQAQFARIRAAYDRLRDPIASLEHRLFTRDAADTFESLLAKEQSRRQAWRIPTQLLLSLTDD